jgi:pyruvate,water dikinase
MSNYIKRFSDINLADIPLVGGKNASLGELFTHLSTEGIRVPDGFATTALAFWNFVDSNQIREALAKLMQQLDRKHFSNLREIGQKARALILSVALPEALSSAIADAYQHLGVGQPIEVAVRSSATAEDLPNASFAGQHESYLNIKGREALLEAVKKCFASLYTDRAIKYREDKGFDHGKIALSVGIQKMVRSDLASSGVGFTLEPESGFRDVVHLSGVWGLGENLVQGTVTPDEFLIFKPTLKQGKNALIQKRLGDKALTMVYDPSAQSCTVNQETPVEKRHRFVLSDEEIMQLSRWALVIEEHYGKPMDIEWAKDGITGELFIIQARPETVQSSRNPYKAVTYILKEKGTLLVCGDAVGSKIATGIARIISSAGDGERLQAGEIVVTDMTSPDWDPVLKRAAGIVTNKGGRTSHASIVARELGVPAVVGTGDATTVIKDGDPITISCGEGKEGKVYMGSLSFTKKEIDFSGVSKPRHTKAMLIVGDPSQAFSLSFYPNDGVGLMRMEFIINHLIQIHPMALVNPGAVKDQEAINKIEQITASYIDKKQFFIDRLSQGIASVAAAFYPKEVIIRMSDFKTNEYAHLIGGAGFEPKEENPMLGFRGASRYYHELYREGFRMECEAVRKVRCEMGLTNVKMMIPFCRTINEAKKVIMLIGDYGLDRAKDPSLEIYMMAEIPSNVLLAEQFAQIFDGFSIGSNDLTQLTLGIDRDSTLVKDLFDEQDEAARTMIGWMIEKARKSGHKVGLCGQAPSDLPEFAQFLVQKGIDSISFNPDALLQGIQNIIEAEKKGSPEKAVAPLGQSVLRKEKIE